MTRFDDTVLFEMTQYTKPYANISVPEPYPLHLHKHVEFVFVTEGELNLFLNKKEYNMKAGDCALITPYTLHDYAPEHATGKRFVLVFEPESIGVLGNILLEHYPTKPVIQSHTLQSTLPKSFDALFAEIINDQSNTPIETSHRFLSIIQLLDAVLPHVGLKKQSSNKSTAFIQAVNLCNTSYEDDTFSIYTLAETLHISESYLKQLFNKEIGMSVKKYLTMLRLSKAETMLIQSIHSIAHIAQTSGFGSVRTFNRIFKEHKGMTPLAFRSTIINE